MKVTPIHCFLVILLLVGCGAPAEYNNSHVSNYGSGSSSSTSSGLELFYKPTGLPITFYLNSGGFGISFDATVVTPIGTFGAKYARKLEDRPRPFQVDRREIVSTNYQSGYQYENVKMQSHSAPAIAIAESDYIIQIKNPDGEYDIFKISSSAQLKIKIDGKAELNIRNNYLKIDNSASGITSIELQNIGTPDHRPAATSVNNPSNRPGPAGTATSRPNPASAAPERRRTSPSTSYSNNEAGLKQQKKDAKSARKQLKENIKQERKQKKAAQKAEKQRQKQLKKQRKRRNRN